MKKAYQKPKVTRIKLAVKEVVLGDCWSSVNTAAIEDGCQIAGCAGPGESF
jgi:hypothetical protein